MDNKKQPKYTQNGLCIKCQGQGHVIESGVTSIPCSVCDGMGMKYRKPRGPRKPQLPVDAIKYMADYVNEELDRGNPITTEVISNALEAFNGGAR